MRMVFLLSQVAALGEAGEGGEPWWLRGGLGAGAHVGGRGRFPAALGPNGGAAFFSPFQPPAPFHSHPNLGPPHCVEGR